MTKPWEKYQEKGPWTKYRDPGPAEEFNPRPAVAKAQAEMVEGMGTGGRLLAGAGQGVADIGYGTGQLVGAVSQDEIRAKAERDKPLLDTAAGTIGSVGGQIAAFAPMSFIPGANTATGATLLGGAAGLAAPVAEGNVIAGKAKNAAIGAGVARGAFQFGQFIGGRVADNVARRNLEGLQNSGRTAVLQRGQQLGYVVEPTLANPTYTNRALEGIAGKLTTAQQAAIHNQSVTNSIARRSIGVADDVPLSVDVLRQVRQQASGIYQRLRNLSLPNQPPGTHLRVRTDSTFRDALDDIVAPFRRLARDVPEEAGDEIEGLVRQYSRNSFDSSNVVDLIRRRRDAATMLFRRAEHPEQLDLARANRALADAFEDLLERHVQRIGNPQLVDEFRQARQLIARTYTLEAALNQGSGNIVAQKLAAQMSKGKPLSGELLDAARFAAAFKKSVQEVTSSMPGISPLDVATGAISASASQNPAGFAVMAARPLIRATITSPGYQRHMVIPNYGPTIGQRVIPRIIQNRAAPVAAAALINSEQ